MKKFILIVSALYGLVSLNGCGAIVVASSAITTAKSAYEGYEAFSAIKKVQTEAPALGKYRNVFISFDVQPRKGNREEVNGILEEIYARSLKEIAGKNGLKVTCKAYQSKSVPSGANALVIQIREQDPPMWKKMVSGDKIHTMIDYVDRKSSLVLARGEDVSKDYEEMMHRLVISAMAQLNPEPKSGRKPWSSTVAYFRDRDQSIMTEQERAILRNG